MHSRFALAAAACAAALLSARPVLAQDSTAIAPSVEVTRPAARVHHDRNVLTAEELSNRHDPNAYALVRALRPNWLRGVRGASSLRFSTSVIVYRDGMRVGGPEALADVNLESIKEIHYYDAIEATQRWGTDHGGGAIVIVTR